MKKSPGGLAKGAARPEETTTIFVTKVHTRRKKITVEVDRTWNEFIIA